MAVIRLYPAADGRELAVLVRTSVLGTGNTRRFGRNSSWLFWPLSVFP